MEKTIAKIISILFQPLFIPIYGILLLANSPYLFMYNQYGKLFVLGAPVFFCCVLPLFIIIILYKKGKVNTLQISDRKERFLPYLYTFLSASLLVVLYSFLRVPPFMIYLVLGLVFSLAVVMVVNTKWKISAHMSGIGGLTGAVFAITYYFHQNEMWLYIIVIFCAGLIAWSRLRLKAHTPWQLVAGFFVGVLFMGIYPLYNLYG